MNHQFYDVLIILFDRIHLFISKSIETIRNYKKLYLFLLEKPKILIFLSCTINRYFIYSLAKTWINHFKFINLFIFCKLSNFFKVKIYFWRRHFSSITSNVFSPWYLHNLETIQNTSPIIYPKLITSLASQIQLEDNRCSPHSQETIKLNARGEVRKKMRIL